MQARPSTDPQTREDVAVRLHSAAIHLLRRVRSEDPRSGLSPARASLLSILVFGGARTIGQLVKAEQVSFATISKLVNGLEQDGLVVRRTDRDDQRVVNVVATAKARRIMDRARARRVEHLARLLEGLPPAGWQTLEEAVKLIEAALHSGPAKEIP